MNAYKVRHLTSGTATTRRVEDVVRDATDPSVWHVLESAAPNPHLRSANITAVVEGDVIRIEGHRKDETAQYLQGIRTRIAHRLDIEHHEPTD